MSNDTADVDRGYTWDVLPASCHVCLIYDSDAQRDAIVPRYLEAGLRQGELVRYFTDGTPPEVVRSWLSGVELDSLDASESGPLRIAKAESAYCPDGRFEPRKVVAAMEPGYVRAMNAGFSGVRTTGEMAWALRGLPGSERLMEYEALINTVPHTYPHTGMCQYDARLFDGATLFKVLRVHPHVVAGGQVVKNPYYVTAEAFLAEMGLSS